MQFTLTDLQIEIKENSNKLLKENIDLLETIQKVDDNCRLDKKVWQLVIDQGWLALDVPEEDGGLGFSNTDTAILSEVLGYYMPIIPIFSSGVVFKHILLNSRKEKKDELLSEIISGQKIGTFAVYENDKYDINENTISTQLTPVGSEFNLNGHKKYVMFGDVSDYLAVLAKFESSFKIVLLPTDTDGVEVKQTTSLDQTRPMCEVTIQDVKLGQDSILIDLDKEISEWNKIKNIALGYLAMEQVGASQACLDMSTEYAKERIQFGRPIGSFQAIQHICANMLMQLESAKSVGEYLKLKTIYAPYKKGVFEGIAKGKVLPVGGDFPLYYLENGNTFSDLDIDMVLMTDDNEKIYCKATGVFNYVTETFESIKFQTHWRFRTSSEKYEFLNDVMGIGFGYVLPADSEYNFQHDVYDVTLNE